jgi:hypothetical protein
MIVDKYGNYVRKFMGNYVGRMELTFLLGIVVDQNKIGQSVTLDSFTIQKFV